MMNDSRLIDRRRIDGQLTRVKILSRSACLLAAFAIGLGSAAPLDRALGAEPGPDPKRRQVGVYGWAMDIRGTLVSPDGTINEFEVPFKEIFARLEGVLQVVGEIDLESWYVIVDATWAELGGGYDGDLWALDVDVKQQIYDLKVGYDVFHRVESDTDQEGRPGWVWVSAVDLLAGARYYGTQTTLTETARLDTESRQTLSKISRWDPVIGARGTLGLTRRWSATLIGDLGGMGIGSAADFTYQLDGNVAYRFSPAVSVFVGYRVLSTTTGLSGGGDNTVRQQGPRIGASYAF